MKKNLNNIYSLNLSRSNDTLCIFGFSNLHFKNIKKNNFLEDSDLNYFLLKNLENPDFLLKKKNDSITKNIEIGNYKGYKYSRSLPIKNQRTKTNSKTARRLNNNL